MRKLSIFAAVILAAIIIGMFFINHKAVQTDVTAEKTKVGFVLNGEVTDHSWGQSHYEGMNKSAEALNLSVQFYENVSENEQCKEIMEKMIEDGCKIIIANSFGYGQYALEVAKEHPDVYFFHATGVETAKNLSTFFGRIYQMRYLSGIVAGMQTETNEIGYVAAYEMSEVNRGINAFTLGVRSVNPDAVVHVIFVNSWLDEELTRAATENLLEQNEKIDVLAMHTDSLAVLDMAEQKGIWSIGYNVDNSALYPNTYLTAPIWAWENFYTPYILECLQGKFTQKSYWEGAETGIVSLAELTPNVKPGIGEVVREAMEKINSGVFDVFYGPICDNTGKIRIEEGESMTDNSMLNEFDWFVEGVEINE